MSDHDMHGAPQQQHHQQHHQGGGGGGHPADDEPLPASTCVLRLRGLPYSAREAEVREFFEGFDVDASPSSVVVVTHGFQRGEAYVRFVSPEACAAAHAAKNRCNMKKRYIELYASTPGALDLQRAAEEQLATHKRYFIRLRGLPFQAGEGNVREFLDPLGFQAVLSVHLCQAADGRFNGNAFVEVNSEHAVRDALDRLNRMPMGTRYIEIFESTLLERDASMTAERRRRRTANTNAPQAMHGGMPHEEMMGRYGAVPEYFPYGGGGGNGGQQQFAAAQRPAFPVVRIRGLPFTANESTIAEFLDGVNIPAQGVHMVYDANERPTGEAFVEVYSEADVQVALGMHHKSLGRRYIEVFRSSQGEMHRLQMGEAPVPEGYYGTPAAYQHQHAAQHHQHHGYAQMPPAPFRGHQLPVSRDAQWN